MKLKPNIVPHIDIRDGSGSLGSLNTCILSKTFKDPYSGMDKTTDLVTVFDAILTSRQTREKLQCLYENPMSNNFRKKAVLEKI